MSEMPATSDVPTQTCPSCGTTVNVADAEPLATVVCPKCAARIRVARAFDNFELVETLGIGGMGAVYKARDTRLGRFVALKLLRKELSADPAEAARLEQEARVTASVNHPNVVQVYSAGTAHGQIYLVMELVAHGSLDDLMAQHTRIPEAQVLEAGIQVAKGLQAAHEKGLIHRDVKPANILYLDERTAKIGDFGLAGAAEQKVEGRSEIWGTPYYVAPERLDNAPEDFRSDIFSLGATLFHAVAGVPPMEGETTSAAELRRLKAHPPDLRKIAPDVSKETARVINRMLRPNPGQRFASYQHLIDQLERAARSLDGTGTPSRLPLILGGVIVLLLAAGAGGVYLWQKNRAQPAEVAGTTAQPTATPDLAPLQRRYETARQQLLERKYEAAATAFSRLTSDAKNHQPLLNWTRLHLGLTHYLEGRTQPAREAFQQIEKAGPYARNELANFFVNTARGLTSTGVIRVADVGSLNPKTADAFALLLYGVKNWQLGGFAEAAALLEKFTAAEPTGEYAWISSYKPIAQQYLSDYRLYAKNRPPEQFASTDAIPPAIEKLQSVQKELKTRGTLRDAVANELKNLSAQLKRREKEEQSAAEAERQKLLAKELPAWEAALAKARAEAATYDFVAAFEALKDVKVTEESLVEAREHERQRYNYLRDWKTRLITDLKSGRYQALIKIAGAEYQGALSATDSEIALRIPGGKGSAPFPWTRFTPDTLLAMSMAFASGASDGAERYWEAAVFAHATGQAEAAEKLAEAAVKAKPDLQDERKALGIP